LPGRPVAVQPNRHFLPSARKSAYAAAESPTRLVSKRINTRVYAKPDYLPHKNFCDKYIYYTGDGLMDERVQFSEVYINGIPGRGFYSNTDNREQLVGEVMTKVFEIGEQIRKDDCLTDRESFDI